MTFERVIAAASELVFAMDLLEALHQVQAPLESQIMASRRLTAALDAIRPLLPEREAGPVQDATAERSEGRVSVAMELGASPAEIEKRMMACTEALGEDGLPRFCNQRMDEIAAKAEALGVEPFDLMALFIAGAAARIDSGNTIRNPGRRTSSLMAVAFITYQRLMEILLDASEPRTVQ
jgi:hypothetical protein